MGSSPSSFDSARIRGLNRVLWTLPGEQRKAIKSVLDDPAQSLLPSTAQIWRGWHQLLEISGLGFLLSHEVPFSGVLLFPDIEPRLRSGVG
jgi:hypothetical protein